MSIKSESVAGVRTGAYREFGDHLEKGNLNLIYMQKACQYERCSRDLYS